MVGPSPISDEIRQDEIKALSDVFDRLLASEAWMGEIAAGDGAHPGANGYNALARIVHDWSGWLSWFD